MKHQEVLTRKETRCHARARRAIEALQIQQDHKNLTPYEQLHGKLPSLLSGDIILIRHRKSKFFRRILRIVTNSYWDHAVMVLYRKDPEKGYSSNVIFESRNSKGRLYYYGAELHRLDKYLSDPSAYDIGVKRVTWLTKAMRHRIRSFALANVDTPYYPFWSWKLFIALFSDRMKERILATHRYTCSALIQKAYYEALDIEHRQKVLFRSATYMPIQTLDLTSPADLATSMASEWLYNRN